VPDGIDGRYKELVRGLRSAEVTASPELRERVRAIVERGPEPPAISRWSGALSRRRLALVLVPVTAALAVAVGLGALSSGGSPTVRDGAKSDDALPTTVNGRAAFSAQAGKAASGGVLHTAPAATVPAPAVQAPSAPGTPPPSGSRHQLYEADLRLRVSDLAGTTKQAIQLTRAWRGYLVSVDYGSGQKSGTAYLELRVPIAKVQTAVTKLIALGTILDDHVSIQDVQGQVNQRYVRMQDLKAKVAKLRADLAQPNLTTSQRAFFQAALAERFALLTRLQQQQQAELTKTSFATVGLALQTKQAAAVVPSKPGRIGQALHNIGRVLVTEAEVMLYVLLVGAPFVVLVLLFWAGRRTVRRRSDEGMLARRA
jgi:hypothetical protein